MTRLMPRLLVLAATMLLSSCIVVPGKFVATLDIRADRSFTFTYVGELIATKSKDQDLSAPQDEGDGTEQNWDEGEGEPQMLKIAAQSGDKPLDLSDSPDDAKELQDVAEALSEEYGFRAVKYVGHRTLQVDYRITGTLDHAFVFPFNPDGDVVLPFLAIELRGKDRVRIKAPGFANEQSNPQASGMPGLGSMNDAAARLDGTFTLTTNAEIVSQNQEKGAQTQSDGSRKIVWIANSKTKDAPMAVLRMPALP